MEMVNSLPCFIKELCRRVAWFLRVVDLVALPDETSDYWPEIESECPAWYIVILKLTNHIISSTKAELTTE